MKSIFITTIYGHTSPGIVKALAQETREAGGEWLSSKVMKMDGQFVAMMKVSVDQESVDRLKNDLEQKFSDLQFFYASAATKTSAPTKTITLVVDCRDRSGLTHDINNVLYNLDLVVENMEFNRFPVSSLGESVFSARLTLAVPEATSAEIIAEEIEALSEDIRVNVID